MSYRSGIRRAAQAFPFYAPRCDRIVAGVLGRLSVTRVDELRAALAADRARAQELVTVSRETLTRLDRLVALLLEWQQTRNLIAASTIPSIWTRHIADSLQLLDFAPAAKTWVDLGSPDLDASIAFYKVLEKFLAENLTPEGKVKVGQPEVIDMPAKK